MQGDNKRCCEAAACLCVKMSKEKQMFEATLRARLIISPTGRESSGTLSYLCGLPVSFSENGYGRLTLISRDQFCRTGWTFTSSHLTATSFSVEPCLSCRVCSVCSVCDKGRSRWWNCSGAFRAVARVSGMMRVTSVCLPTKVIVTPPIKSVVL